MQFRKIQWFVLLTILAYLFMVIIQGIFISSELVQVYGTELIFLVFGSLFLIRHRRDVFDFVRLQMPPWWSFLIVVPIVLSAIFLSSFVTAVSMLLTRSFNLVDIPATDLTSVTSSNFLLVLSFSVLPGIVEEFYCRGVLLHAYQESISTRASIFYSALIFGLLHFNLWNILSPMILGIVFALLTIRFDSIVPAMFGHALFNLLVIGFEKIRLAGELVDDTTIIGWGDIPGLLPTTILSIAFLVFVFRQLGVGAYFRSAPSKITWWDHIPTILVLIVFVAINYFIQKGLGL